MRVPVCVSEIHVQNALITVKPIVSVQYSHIHIIQESVLKLNVAVVLLFVGLPPLGWTLATLLVTPSQVVQLCGWFAGALTHIFLEAQQYRGREEIHTVKGRIQLL